MSVFRRFLSPSVLGLVAAVGFLGACTDDKIVYRDREPFNPPPDAASGFLGYYTASEQQTTCGNCHVGTQSQWKNSSGHAGAWAALVAIGQDDNPACQACHGVSEYGNAATAASGISVVDDAAYHDVQCESCHGAGFAHVQAPDTRATWPIPRADVTTDPGTGRALDTDATCAACHGSAHGPRSLAGDWLASAHGNIQAYPSGRPECRSCHDGKAVIQRFTGQPSNYVERDSTTGQYQYLAIGCTSCHDPHGSPYPKMLRAAIDVPDLQANLCMSCHNRSTTISASYSNGDRGAHAAQGPNLLGTGVGYIPAGFAFDTVQAYGSHASGANPRLCAGCHVNGFSATDGGGVEVDYSGHEFLAIPCVDGAGVITDDQNCGYGATDRNWGACTACHGAGDPVVASTIFNAERQAIKNLVETIWINNGDPVGASTPRVDAGDGGYLADIFIADPTQFTKEAAGSAVLTPAEGAIFNVQIYGEGYYSHNDGSKGVHNPFYAEALLAATIQELEATYGGILSIRTEPAIRAMIDKALSRPGVTYVRKSSRVASR